MHDNGYNYQATGGAVPKARCAQGYVWQEKTCEEWLQDEQQQRQDARETGCDIGGISIGEIGAEAGNDQRGRQGENKPAPNHNGTGV